MEKYKMSLNSESPTDKKSVKGNVQKKRFTYRTDWKYFSEYMFKNVSRIENIYNKLETKQRDLYKKTSEIINQILKTPAFKDPNGRKHWLAHAKQCDKKWYLYTISKCVYTSYNVTGTDIPDYPINLDLGQKMYLYSRDQYSKRYSEIKTLLDDAIILKLKNNEKNKYETCQKLFEITINGRKYFYKGTYQAHGFIQFEKVSWPHDGFDRIELT